MKLVGAPKEFLKLLPLENQPQDVEDIGWPSPNLEKILTLKPDLILGTTNYHQRIYSLLSHIAATILVKPASDGNWKEIVINFTISF
ncbi:MAG: ABC transporter substrate-binding protein [Nostoc sp.]|uniref:ABC transporter substrate-binding protein n=1 Tax=Nostoc sp. TaxID=1180 RepID=UPI002FF4E53C